MPKNVGRKRSTRSSKVLKEDEVLGSAMEDSIRVPKDLKMGSGIASSRVSKKNENLSSTRAAKKDDWRKAFKLRR